MLTLAIRCPLIFPKKVVIKLNEPRHEKPCLLPYANNKAADQPAHPRSLINAFFVRYLDSVIHIVAFSEISRL